jgi:hypothetical protein
MKSFASTAITLCIAALLFSSCSKKNEEGKMIPKNAMFVVHLNTKSLKDKLTWNDIIQTNWYRMAVAYYQENHAATSDQVKKLFGNPENSGIDLDGGLVFFAEKNPGTEGEIVLEGKVKNKKDFEQFNKNLDETATTRTEGDLTLLTLKGKSVVAWNDDHFVYVMSGGPKTKLTSMDDSAAMQGNMSPLVDKTTALSAVCKRLFSLKSDSSLEKTEKFSDLLHEKGDVHAWINTEEITKNSSSLGMVGMLKLDVFLKDNISTYTVDFENGKINVKQRGYAGKEFTDFLKKYSGGKINTDLIKTIPSQNVFGVFIMNFKPEGLKELIKLTGLDGALNTFTGQLGFNLDDFVKANKGDIMIALTDLRNENTDTTTYVGPVKPDLNILFSVAIGDKPSFQKLVDAGKKITGQMGSSNSISYGQNDKIFAVSNRQQFVNSYLAGNSNNKYDFMDKFSGQPVNIFIDIHKILTVLSAGRKANADEEQIMTESLRLWNNIYITGGDMDGNAITGNTEINLMDPSTNSLKQLNLYVDQIAKTEMAKKEREKSDMKSDSLMVPPPVDIPAPVDSAH